MHLWPHPSHRLARAAGRVHSSPLALELSAGPEPAGQVCGAVRLGAPGANAARELPVGAVPRAGHQAGARLARAFAHGGHRLPRPRPRLERRDAHADRGAGALGRAAAGGPGVRHRRGHGAVAAASAGLAADGVQRSHGEGHHPRHLHDARAPVLACLPRGCSQARLPHAEAAHGLQPGAVPRRPAKRPRDEDSVGGLQGTSNALGSDVRHPVVRRPHLGGPQGIDRGGADQELGGEEGHLARTRLQRQEGHGGRRDSQNCEDAHPQPGHGASEAKRGRAAEDHGP
mmetsp:Transcript_31668/g.104949  ORF Transcript_31668/g.104949 Transcript_31668/m.104949 type:complete len:286 (-) Transcript_31668:990-1847(-)